jgi:hypothetical protein
MNEIIMFPANLKYRIFRDPVDMRKSFDGLGKLVFRHLGKIGDNEPVLFFFFNKHRTAVKALFCNRRMMTILYGKLKEGAFKLPGFSQDQKTIDLSPTTMTALLDGLTVLDTRPVQKAPPTQQEVPVLTDLHY